MALLLVAVDGLTLTPQGIVVPGSGTVTIVSVPSPKVLAEAKGVYKTPLRFTVAGASAAGYVPGTVASVGTVEIPATATKCLAEGILVMRINDQASVRMVGQLLGTGVTQFFNETWQITDPNQVKVLCN